MSKPDSLDGDVYCMKYGCHIDYLLLSSFFACLLVKRVVTGNKG